MLLACFRELESNLCVIPMSFRLAYFARLELHGIALFGISGSMSLTECWLEKVV